MSELFYEHVIENDNIDQILKLNVNEYFYAEDKNKKNVIHGKILLDNKYLSIETTYLNVVLIDKEKKVVYVELNETTETLLNYVDNTVKKLLCSLLEENKCILPNKNIQTFVDTSYISMIREKDGKKIFKVPFDNDTIVLINNPSVIKQENNPSVIKQENNNSTNLSINDITIGDNMRFKLQIESVNLWVDDNIGGIRIINHVSEICKETINDLDIILELPNKEFKDNTIFKKNKVNIDSNILMISEVEPKNKIKTPIVVNVKKTNGKKK
jgi:hypothetical protein